MAVMAFDRERGGGSVRVAFDIATRLASRGHLITVVCEDSFGRNLEKEEANGLTVLRYRLPRAGTLRISRGLEHIHAVKRLVRKHLKEAPAIIHGHSPLQYRALLDLFCGRSRCCYTVHSPAVEELSIVWRSKGKAGKVKALFGLPIIKRLERSSYQQSSRLTALSDYTIRLIAQHYGNAVASKIALIPGWVDTQRFRPPSQTEVSQLKRQFGWPIHVPTFFVLRRLEPRMGLDNLLRSHAIVKERGFRAHLAIGGSGSMRTQLEELRNKLGLREDVSFLGFIPNDRVPMAYSACDASVIPSTRLECFGLIALESLACGRTTIVTPVGALPEITKGIEPAWITPNATAAGMAEMLIDFINGRLPRHDAEELHSYVRNAYSAEKGVCAYEETLLGGPVTPSSGT